MGELVVSRVPDDEWQMCSSVRVLLCDAGEMRSPVLNLIQAGGWV